MLAVSLVPYITWRVVPPYLFTLSDALLPRGRAAFGRARRGTLSARRMEDRLDFRPECAAAGVFVGSSVNGDPLRWIIVAGQYGFAFAVLPSPLLREQRSFLVTCALALISGVATMACSGRSSITPPTALMKRPSG